MHLTLSSLCKCFQSQSFNISPVGECYTNSDDVVLEVNLFVHAG